MLQTFDTTSPRLSFISKFTLYIVPTGQIIVIAGNQRVVVTPEEARAIMEYHLNFCSNFKVNRAGNGNGYNQEREV